MERRISSAALALTGEMIAAAVSAVLLVFVVMFAQPQRLGATNDTAPPQAKGYKLVFSDDFDTLDLGAGGNRTHSWYSGVWFSPRDTVPGNVSASGSVLSLIWTHTHAESDASITTLSRDKQHFKAWRYGYFEARMRWDVVKGAWPAFWLIPVQDATGQDIYNGKKRSGEIDVFEGQGDRPHTYYGTVHEWIDSHTDHASRNNAFELPETADMSQFHVYGLLWTPGKVSWYFDNRLLHSEETPAICDIQDFFMVLTMQEGVNWKNNDLSGVTSSRMTLNVDWVRVWQK
jgi:hypothetical protein